MIPSRQKGTHTWTLYVHYHLCPQCGKVIESRHEYELKDGKWIKELKCAHCGHSFSETKPFKKLGFLANSSQAHEFRWGWNENT